MREILFRGKSVHSGEWLYGSLVRVNEQALIVPIPDFPEQEYADQNVDPETVGQYTGLKDKHGNRIFEGDLIAITNPYDGVEASGVAEVTFSYAYAGGWVATSEGKNLNLGTRTEYLRVVSNIHDQKGGVES